MPDINAAYRWAIETCNNPNVGYPDLNTHPEWRNQVTVDGITYYDCSSFIWYALEAGGFDVATAHGSNYPFTTRDMGATLLALGFRTVSKTGQILPGDIGVHNRGSSAYAGHTEMCYTGGNGAGVFMGAHGHWRPLAEQVAINTDVTQGTFWDTIYRYGDGAGGEAISLYVIAAMCGNFYQESGVNPGIWEGTNQASWDSLLHGFGLGQWTNTGGDTQGRLWQLHSWVTSNGYADGDGYGQLAFLLHENYWTPDANPQFNIDASAYSTLEDFLTSDSTNISELTKEYFFHWEGINDGTLSRRQQFAQRAYSYITEHYGDESINTWTSVNAYITETQALNNCVLIARYLSSGYIPIYTGGFKIWMAKRHWIQRRRKRL